MQLTYNPYKTASQWDEGPECCLVLSLLVAFEVIVSRFRFNGRVLRKFPRDILVLPCNVYPLLQNYVGKLDGYNTRQDTHIFVNISASTVTTQSCKVLLHAQESSTSIRLIVQPIVPDD